MTSTAFAISATVTLIIVVLLLVSVVAPRVQEGALRGESKRFAGLARDLAEADIKLYPKEWLGILLLIGVVVGVNLSFVLSDWALLPLSLVAAYAGGTFYIRSRHRRRERLFAEQIGPTFSLLAGALRTGFAFDQAMSSVAEDSPSPMREELQRYLKEVALGLNSDQALNNMLARNPSIDLSIAVRATQMNRNVGGNLPVILDTVADTIRNRVQIRAEIRSVTAQTRLSGYIIALLPPGLAAFLAIVDPAYFAPMLTTGLGLGILATSGLFILTGLMIIRRIVDIRI